MNVLNNTAPAKSLTADATPGTKGAWVEFFSSIRETCEGVIVSGTFMNPTGSFLLDIGVGPSGSEVVVAENVASYPVDAGFGTATFQFIPILFQKGERIVGRVESSVGNAVVQATFSLLKNTGYPPGRHAKMMGKGSSGQLIQLTTDDTYVEIEDSVEYSYKYVIPVAKTDASAAAAAEDIAFHWAMGPAASEVDFWVQASTGNPRSDDSPHIIGMPISISIPKGERLAAKFSGGGTVNQRVGLIGVI
jgi:hypothetical protein